MKKHSRGFTLIELMVTIAILGIMMAIAMPSYRNMIQSNKINSIVSRWQQSFYLAQAEAMRLKRTITLCASKDGETCNSDDFIDGWIILDNTRLIQDNLPEHMPKLTIEFNAGSSKSQLRIKPNGSMSSFVGGNLQFKIDGELKKKLSISNEGRMRLE